VAGLGRQPGGLRLPDAMATALQPHRRGRAAAGPDGGGRRAEARRPEARARLATAPAGRSATLLLPALALALCAALPLPPAQGAVLMAFAAVPTASSAYVLAARMGGEAGFVAGLVTVSTLLGALSLPLWLTLHDSLPAR
jgi:malonate transporter